MVGKVGYGRQSEVSSENIGTMVGSKLSVESNVDSSNQRVGQYTIPRAHSRLMLKPSGEAQRGELHSYMFEFIRRIHLK
jgi:hypothetical protein